MIVVAEYYKSLTFATTGRPAIRAPAVDCLNSQEAVDALGGLQIFKAAGKSPRIPENKKVNFGHELKSKIVIERFSKCVRVMIHAAPLVGEIIAWGDAGKLPSVSLFMHLGYGSLRALHDARETRVVINNTHNRDRKPSHG